MINFLKIKNFIKNWSLLSKVSFIFLLSLFLIVFIFYNFGYSQIDSRYYEYSDGDNTGGGGGGITQTGCGLKGYYQEGNLTCSGYASRCNCNCNADISISDTDYSYIHNSWVGALFSWDDDGSYTVSYSGSYSESFSRYSEDIRGWPCGCGEANGCSGSDYNNTRILFSNYFRYGFNGGKFNIYASVEGLQKRTKDINPFQATLAFGYAINNCQAGEIARFPSSNPAYCEKVDANINASSLSCIKGECDVTISWNSTGLSKVEIYKNDSLLSTGGLTGSLNVSNILNSAAGVYTFGIRTDDGYGTMFPVSGYLDTVTINVYSPVLCSPRSQNINVNSSANFTASGGDGNYSWSAPGGDPSSGSGSSFSTRYSAIGTKTVTVSSFNKQSNCIVNVISSTSTVTSSVTAFLTANGATGITVNVGDRINYSWSSSGANRWSSYYTVSPSDRCGHQQGQQYSWVANDESGSTSGTVEECQGGSTYNITYIAENTITGQSAQASISVSVRERESTTTTTTTTTSPTITPTSSQSIQPYGEQPPGFIYRDYCRINANLISNPDFGNLATNFILTYNLSVEGIESRFSHLCCYYSSTSSRCITVTREYTPNCVFQGDIFVKLNNINKDWNYTIDESGKFSKKESVNGFNIIKNYFYNPDYHGRHNFSYGYSGKYTADVNFSCPISHPIPEPNSFTYSENKLSEDELQIFVRPTNVEASAQESTSNINHPQNISTELKKFIVGFDVLTRFMVRLFNPYVFNKDALPGYPSNFWLEIIDPQGKITKSDEISLNGDDTRRESIDSMYQWTPKIAGDYTLKTCHKADDESTNRPDVECALSNITVYRYLCYLGFCWECPKEPTTSSGFINVNNVNCQIVEPAKCQTYINSDCKAKGKE